MQLIVTELNSSLLCSSDSFERHEPGGRTEHQQPRQRRRRQVVEGQQT